MRAEGFVHVGLILLVLLLYGLLPYSFTGQDIALSQPGDA